MSDVSLAFVAVAKTQARSAVAERAPVEVAPAPQEVALAPNARAIEPNAALQKWGARPLASRAQKSATPGAHSWLALQSEQAKRTNKRTSTATASTSSASTSSASTASASTSSASTSSASTSSASTASAAAEARIALLLDAHLAAYGARDDGAGLRAELGRLANRWAGTPEGRILELALAGEAKTAGSIATKHQLLNAGLKAAVEAIARPPADGAETAAHILAGFRWAVDVDDNSRPLREATILALAENCLEQIEAVLPHTHPARAAMADLDRSATILADLDDPSIYGLRIGRLRYALENNKLPPEFPAGTRSMPNLSLRAVLNGALLEKFRPEIPDAKTIDIQQSTQGALENCYYVAAWSSAIEKRPETFGECAKLEGEQIRFSLHTPSAAGGLEIREELIDPIFYVDTQGELLYAGDRDHTWMALAEKAFAYVRRAQPSYHSLALGTGAEGFRAIFGSDETTRRPLGFAKRGESLELLAHELQQLVEQKIPATTGTHPIAALYRDTQLTPGHAYVLRGIREVEGGWEVDLRNMQREHTPAPASSFDAAHQKARPMENERRFLEQIKNPGDLSISLENFDRLFGHVDTARPLEPVAPPGAKRAEATAKHG